MKCEITFPSADKDETSEKKNIIFCPFFFIFGNSLHLHCIALVLWEDGGIHRPIVLSVVAGTIAAVAVAAAGGGVDGVDSPLSTEYSLG